MNEDECRRRFGAADHACLATTGADGAPHLVPVVFDLTGDEVAVVIDHKPKRTTQLRRLRNISENPRVALLADEYSSEWDALWWVRADGTAEVVSDGARRDQAVQRLQRRYPQYRQVPPTGPVILTAVHRWTGWAASAHC